MKLSYKVLRIFKLRNCYLGTHKTFTPPFFFDLKPIERKIHKTQRELYESSLLDDSKFRYISQNRCNSILIQFDFRYEPCNRFPNEREYGVKVVCDKKIYAGEDLKTLAGQCFYIHESDVQEGVNDFSMIYSNMKHRQMLFLGPAAYVNHDCEANCTWASLVSKSYVHLKSCRSINPGEEITAHYGNNYFGINNQNCRCHSCEMKGIG